MQEKRLTPPLPWPADLRLAVISPFLDRRHGTERVIIEQLERLAADPEWEIHIYAERVEDVAGVSRFPGKVVGSANRIFWHKVRPLPGPHFFAYMWWFFANQFSRWYDAKFRGLTYDLVYSPGINAWDADAIAVHIVFHEFYRRVGPSLQLSGAPLGSWPRRIHRQLYYRLIMGLERRIYTNPKAKLAAVANLVSNHLAAFFSRSDVCVIPNSVDAQRFTPEIRAEERPAARQELGIADGIFALLLVGNDWKKKGLDTLLISLAACKDLPMTLIVAGSDDREMFLPQITKLGLKGRVIFTGSTGDIVRFYAAADLYAGPSLEDSFALPPIEAMACGLPVITSVNNGGSQIITEGKDGFVVSDPLNSGSLAQLIRKLYRDPELCQRIGERAAQTARTYTWERNASETREFLNGALKEKQRRGSEAR